MGDRAHVLAGPDLDALVAAAREVRARAYAPYSQYRVGAALRGVDGAIFLGVNVENSAYPTCQCAERVAIGNAVTAGCRRFEAIAIVCEPSAAGVLGSPCGGCRQVMAEFGLELTVILAAPSGDQREVVALGDLLPRAFTPANLELPGPR
jgi:cytidine deaminase